jgi:hypothetical protein
LFDAAEVKHGQVAHVGGRRAIAHSIDGRHLDEKGCSSSLKSCSALSRRAIHRTRQRDARSRTLVTANESRFQRKGDQNESDRWT